MPSSAVTPGTRSMLEHMDCAAILLSPDYRVLAVNALYKERYGDNVELEVTRCHEVSHGYATPCDRNGEACPLAECRQTRQPARVAHVHHTPRGPEHCDIQMLPIFGEDGEVLAFVEQIRPIDTASAQGGAGKLLGRSRSFSRVIELIERAAPADIPVLLLGESGTGKELVARAVHDRSGRADGPFVPVECSGLSPSLFEAELFGHEKGAFTGADRRREGLVDAARGGTLFLDELGDVPRELQVKLLRLLESRTYRRVGGTETHRADFRLVCATHRDLPTMVQQGDFRRDLYYRVNTFPVRLPPLRERRDDIPLLAEAFLTSFSPLKRLSPAARRVLCCWDYPGNVRELRNVMERAALLSDGELVDEHHLPAEMGGPPRRPVVATTSPGPWPWGEALLPLEAVEARYLTWAAERADDRKSLAKALGVSERTLYRKLQALE